MNKIGVDLIDQVTLSKDLKMKTPFLKDWWGIANLKGSTRTDSYYIYLIDKTELNPGEKSTAEFKFKFSDDERFEIKVQEGQILELNAGIRKQGEFLIQKIVNKKLR